MYYKYYVINMDMVLYVVVDRRIFCLYVYFIYIGWKWKGPSEDWSDLVTTKELQHLVMFCSELRTINHTT